MWTRRMRLGVVLIALGAALVPAFLAAQIVRTEPAALQFGRVNYGGDRCRTLLLTNTTDQPVVLRSVAHPAQPFPTDHADSLYPHAISALEICFRGRRLGPDSSMISIVFDAGDGPDSILVPAYAFGWDSLAVGIGVTMSGKPGSVLRVPLRVFGSIPRAHAIQEFECSMQFNKTLLYPLTNFASHEESLLEGADVLHIDVQRDLSSDPAAVTFRVTTAAPLFNPRSDSILFRPAFLVLQGNAMSCDLTLAHMRFSDGLPRGGAFLKGKFVADSICYQRLRLVDYPTVLSEPEISSFPNPALHSTMIRCFLPGEASTRISVHSLLGCEVALLHDGPLPEGDHAFRFDASQLSRGRYLLRVRTETDRVSTSILVLQ